MFVCMYISVCLCVVNIHRITYQINTSYLNILFYLYNSLIKWLLLYVCLSVCMYVCTYVCMYVYNTSPYVHGMYRTEQILSGSLKGKDFHGTKKPLTILGGEILTWSTPGRYVLVLTLSPLLFFSFNYISFFH